MRYYIDWAITKKITVIDDIAELPESRVFEDFIKETRDQDIYIETGCPFFKIVNLMENNNRIYMVNSGQLKQLRSELEIKDDMNDCLLLRKSIQNSEIGIKLINTKYLDYVRYRPLLSIYQLYSKMNTQILNISQAFDREHGGAKDLALECFKSLINQHKLSIQKMKDSIERDMREFQWMVNRLNMEGVGTTLLGSIIIIAPPEFFPCRSAYLRYCGLKQLDHNRYNRMLKSLYYLCANQVIMRKTDEFRDIYDKFKKERLESEEFRRKYEALKVVHLNKYHKVFITFESYTERVVRNRISTFIAKRIYDTFRNG